MNRLSVFAVASVAALAAACSTAPSKPAAAPATAPAAAAKAAPTATNLSGTWKVTTQTQQGPLESEMTVTQTGDKIGGKFTSQMGSVDYTGTVAGNTAKFGFTFEAQGNSIPIEYNAKIDGGNMSGDVTFGSFGNGTFTAKKAQ